MPDNISRAITNEGSSLINTILHMTRKRTIEELCSTPGIDPKAAEILGQIRRYHEPVNRVAVGKNDPNTLRKARSALEMQINDLNILLFSFFKNDKRVHLPIMHLISLLEYGIDVVDRAYEKADIGENIGGDLGNIRSKMDATKLQILYEKEDPEAKGKKERISARMTPSHYEAYLQIYKSPDKAIEMYGKFQKLMAKKPLTPDEQAELEKLKRVEHVAWDYDASHRYMLEKSSYNQQDVNYAFSLEKMEKKVETKGALMNFTPSSIYKSLILEKIFGEVSQRFENDFTREEVTNKEKVKTWLDDDMSACISRKTDGMKMIIKGIRRSFERRPNKTQIMDELWSVISETWLYRVFPSGQEVLKLKYGNMNAEMAFRSLRDDRTSKTLGLLEGLVKGVIMESRQERDARFHIPGQAE